MIVKKLCNKEVEERKGWKDKRMEGWKDGRYYRFNSGVETKRIATTNPVMEHAISNASSTRPPGLSFAFIAIVT